MKKKYQEKVGKCTFDSSKCDSFWGPKQAPDPQLTVIYLQTKVNEQTGPRLSQIKKRKIAFAKMFRIFHMEIDVL